jgi:hypothetical protein
MTDNHPNSARPEPLIPHEPVDDIHVYVGICGHRLAWKRHSAPGRFWGEVIFQGRAADDGVLVERVRRTALYGTLIERDVQDPIGVFSLTSLPDGPAQPT